MVDELKAAVEAARASRAQADQDNKRVKELLIRTRKERPALKIPEIEDLIGRYFDRTTISRVTAEAIGTSKKQRTAS